MRKLTRRKMSSQSEFIRELRALGLSFDEANAVTLGVRLVALAEYEDQRYVGRDAQDAAVGLCVQLGIKAPDWWEEIKANT